jgi:GT2 family glycosyltransferase
LEAAPRDGHRNTSRSERDARVHRYPLVEPGSVHQETIESVLIQNYACVEHIVVDGGSTDGTAPILRRYGDAHPVRFRWVSEPDGGQADTVNGGLQLARGALIGSQNSDDMYLPGAITALVAELAAVPEAVLAYGMCEVFGPGGVLAGVLGRRFDLVSGTTDSCIPNQSALIRRSALRAVGGVDAGLQFCMDFDLRLRLSQRAGRFVFLPLPLGRFRIHEASKSATAETTFWREKAAAIQAFLSSGGGGIAERAAPAAERGKALIVLAVRERLGGIADTSTVALAEGLRLVPNSADAPVLARTCLREIGPERCPSGDELGTIERFIASQPGASPAFRVVLRARQSRVHVRMLHESQLRSGSNGARRPHDAPRAVGR